MRAALLAVLGLIALTGCTAGSVLPPPGNAFPGGRAGADVPLVPDSCWTGAQLGADPQRILRLSGQFGVNYFTAAHALAKRPAFERTEDCRRPHDVEVYLAVQVPGLAAQLTSYGVLLQTDRPLYAALDRAVRGACMGTPLATAAAQTGLPGAVLEPALPDGMSFGWAPPSPDQFARGQRVFACTLSASEPTSVRYADLLTKRFPTGDRTCIDSGAMLYVDCARKHDRERIAVIDATFAVTSGALPGSNGIRSGPNGRYLAIGPAEYARLDSACTTYLHSISTTTKLTGVAEIDAGSWPAIDGTYPIACEADTRPNQNPLITEGSVYDKG